MPRRVVLIQDGLATFSLHTVHRAEVAGGGGTHAGVLALKMEVIVVYKVVSNIYVAVSCTMSQ